MWGVPASRQAAWITQRPFRQRSWDIQDENGLCQFLSSLEGMPATVGKCETSQQMILRISTESVFSAFPLMSLP